MNRNELRNLIYIQENKPCSKETIKSIVRALVEPVLDSSIEGIILYRFNNKNEFFGILKRLEYTNMKVYDYSKGSELLKNEIIWDNTEFLYVLTARYGVSFIWDWESETIKDVAGMYLLFNSKDLNVSFDIINQNSKTDISAYGEKYKPDRRDNLLMNDAIHNIVEMLNDTNQEIKLAEADQEKLIINEKSSEELDNVKRQIRYIAHELKNQLSICDLYTNIIQKNGDVQNAVNCIQKAVAIANANIVSLKSFDNNELREFKLFDLVEKAIKLATVYSNDVKINVDINNKISIFTDENKFIQTIVNLVKNAIEAKATEIKIECDTNVKIKKVYILISNNGEKLGEEIAEKLFTEGNTSKSNGSGLGLAICKKFIKEQDGEIKLHHSDDEKTTFEIIMDMA